MSDQVSKYEGKSRTEYSAKNTAVAMIARITAILMGYLTRVVFTQCLSEDYVGINGLFNDILQVLALSELGVGTAITFALYKPIAEKDREKQKSLMLLYKRLYAGIAGTVLIAGLMVVPFLPYLTKDEPNVEHLTIVYLLYLLNSVLSYVLIYKKTLIDAHQLSYIGVGYQTGFWILQDCVQIAVLLLTKNFILFVCVMIFCTIGNNISISIKAQKMYPYLKDKDVAPLPKEERQEIKKNVKAMLMHKVGSVVVNDTDNLLLARLAGTTSVAKYSCYFLVVGSIKQVLTQMFQGIMASVGNMGVLEDKKRIRRIFEASFFIGQWVYGLTAICTYEIINLFVGFSFGEKYVFDPGVTLAICIAFYLDGMRQATVAFRDSLGVFYYDRYKAIAEAVINLIASIVLGYYLGTIGVFIGTIVSTVTTSLWVEPCMFYKYRLESPVRGYFIKYAIYAFVTAILWVVCDYACRPVTGMNLPACFLRGIICMLIINSVYLILYCRTKEFALLERKAMRILFKKFAGGDSEKNAGLTGEDQEVLELLRDSLRGEKEPAGKQPAGKQKTDQRDYDKVIKISADHNVLTLMYDRVMKAEQISEKGKQCAEEMARLMTEFSYQLLFSAKEIVELLEENGVEVALVKGAATAAYYPVPELRKSSDIDLLLLHPEQMPKVCEIMNAAGFTKKEEQHALHHVVFAFNDQISVEIHTLLAEPFDNKTINRYMEEVVTKGEIAVERRNLCGVTLPVLVGAGHAYELLLHMLQHFLRSGFGLKLLCDWVVFWDEVIPDEVEKRKTPSLLKIKEQYLTWVEESSVKGFSDMITMICCQYLGLPLDKMEWMKIDKEYSTETFLKEILEAEEFGKSSADRMVVARGNKASDLIREFHHQMRLNFPKSSHIFLLWPVLWCITLIRFLRNNKKVRKTSFGVVIGKALKRSNMMEQLNLFKDK